MKIIKNLAIVIALLVAAHVVITVLAFGVGFLVMSYQPPEEDGYPTISAAYEAVYEKGEQLYDLMLPYAEAHALDIEWYGSNNSITPWQEDAYILLTELKREYEALVGPLTSSAIIFSIRDNKHWYLCIDVPGTGYDTGLFYGPYDLLPYPECKQLEGMGYGWSFVSMPYA